MLLLLSSLLAFFGSYLFIRSFGSGHQGGSGIVLPDGTFISDPRPMIFAIDEVLFILMFPLTLLTAIAALIIVIVEMTKLKIERRTFEGASIILAGSLLFLFFMLGGYVMFGYIGIMATLVLIVFNQYYRSIQYITALLYLSMLLW